MKININLLLFVLALVLASQSSFAKTQWRQLDKNNTVLMTLPQGKVVIELAPQFAPKHVAQFKKLIKQGYYDNTKFYRVITGFVAQAGPDKSRDTAPNLKMESEWQPAKNWSYTQVQQADLFAPETGFVKGFGVGYSKAENKAWLTHCPGVLAMARGSSANSGSSHFYFTIGQAPRYLDRIMTIFGRVVYGMDNVQAIQRTTTIEGEAPISPKDFTPIISMKLMSDVPKKQQIIIEVEQTSGVNFKEKLAKRRSHNSEFFYKKPPPVLDVCQVPLLSRIVTYNQL